MAEASIASAIIAEPIDGQPSATNALKRRKSESVEGEQESKRQRTSPGKKSPNAPKDDATQAEAADGERAAAPEQAIAEPTKEERKRPSVADEKQRSKRLFGALLGSLNQPRDRTSKRRQEIESRKKAELQRQDDERVEDKLRRQEKLTERRRKEQEKVDEQSMHTRHTNLLHTANFLQTTADPKLYYRPWDLRADEEDRIDAQIKEAQARIDEELNEFNKRYHRNGTSNDESPPKNLAAQDLTISPERNQNPSHESHTNGGAENDRVEDVEGQVPAKSDDSKPVEVPDSDITNPVTNGGTVHEDTNGQNQTVDESKDAEEQDDGDPFADGDAEAVIY